MRSQIHAYPAYTCFTHEALTQLLVSEIGSNPHLPILVDATTGSLNQNILDMEVLTINQYLVCTTSNHVRE